MSDALSRWTTDKPTVPGWYWWRSKKLQAYGLVFVEDRYADFIGYSKLALSQVHKDVEWQGPIAPEEEQT